MNKFLVTIIIILILLVTSLSAYFFFSKSNLVKQETPTFTPTEEVKVIKEKNIEMLLNDIGWYAKDSVTLLNGEEIKRSLVKNISVEYSSYIGSTLRQGTEDGEIFASIDSIMEGQTLKFLVYVAQERITASQNKNWWVDHQVIRALDKMLNPTLTDEELIEKDVAIFEKYNAKIDLWEIKL